MKKILILSMLSIFSLSLYAESGAITPNKEPKNENPSEENSLLDFNAIKDIIKNDGLEVELEQRKLKAAEKKKMAQTIEKKTYNYPMEEDFWEIFSEYWLIKNATWLKWDFQKPDYAIQSSVEELLTQRGHVEVSFKILFLDTSELTHFALPQGNGRYLFLVSLPFIKALDLSKVEIALLIYEDFMRAKNKTIHQYLKHPELEKWWGSNFKDRKFDNNLMLETLKRLDQFIKDKGFSFKDQFELTKEIDQALKSDLKIWNTYLTLLGKIDQLTKSNLLYKKHSQIYPSPEMQMGWLKPKVPNI